MSSNKMKGRWGAAALLAVQVALAVLFGLFTRYDEAATPRTTTTTPARSSAAGDKTPDSLEYHYPMFQDVHVMIFVGFGFLMMFLRKYGYSAVGFTLLLGALMVQWAVLCRGYWRLENGKISVSLVTLLNADIAAASVLISMGAVLGKTTPLQLVVMGALEMVFFAANEHICGHLLQVTDLGGSMTVHVFGAYFGLAVSRVLGRPKDTSQEGSSYTSDMFAMIGTVFLWLFWPSFNGALAEGQARHRAVVNTYLALAAGCVVAYAVSALTQRGAKFSMVHVQNATLAGGVGMGTAADLMVQPVGALVIGGLAGAISVAGYAFLQPVLQKRLKVHDTCGVHNLHGMPGVLAALVGAVMAAMATTSQYGDMLYVQFPAMAPNSTEALSDLEVMGIAPGQSRTALQQGGFQLAALATTLVFSSISGLLTGWIITRCALFRQFVKEGLFDDGPHWEVPDVESGTEAPVESSTPATVLSPVPLAVPVAAKKLTEVTATDPIPTLSAEVERGESMR